MRFTRILVLVLFSSLLAVAQDAPQAAPPGSQTPEQAPQQGGQGNWQGRRFPGTGGEITAITGNSLTLKTRDGQTAQVSLSDKTQYRKERADAKVSDFKVGDMVMVRGEQKDDVWQAEVVAARPAGMGMGGGQGGNFREDMGKKFIVGKVTAINGTQLTIQRPDGVSQNITVDENTSFRKDSESVTLADLKVGDKVFGRGEMKNDTFVPSQLNVGQPRFGGPREPGGGAPPQQQPSTQQPPNN
jgi:hypothetical protein